MDLYPHPQHPEIASFDTADAMSVLRDRAFLDTFAVVSVAPPCQGYTLMRSRARKHPRLIAPCRDLLLEWGGVYVIENVHGALRELRNPVQICGQALGLRVRRHRLFESNRFLFGTGCYHPETPIGVYGDHPDETTYARTDGTSRGVRARSLSEAQEAMGIDWMDWGDLTEAIPPTYSEYIGQQLLDQLEG